MSSCLWHCINQFCIGELFRNIIIYFDKLILEFIAVASVKLLH